MWILLQYRSYHTEIPTKCIASNVHSIDLQEPSICSPWFFRCMTSLNLCSHQCQARKTSFERCLTKIAQLARNFAQRWKFLKERGFAPDFVGLFEKMRNRSKRWSCQRGRSLFQAYGLDLCIYQGTLCAIFRLKVCLGELIWIKPCALKALWKGMWGSWIETNPREQICRGIASPGIWRRWVWITPVSISFSHHFASRIPHPLLSNTIAHFGCQ